MSAVSRRSLLPIATTLATLLLWQMAVVVLTIPPRLLPAPTAVAAEIVVRFNLLWPSTLVTIAETVGAIMLSVLISVPLAFAFVYVPVFERSAYPLLVATQAIPKVSLAPLFVVWFGFGPGSKLLVAFLVAFFPLVINTVVGLKSVAPEYVYLVRSMRASEWDILRRVRLPHALPHFFAGLKVAVTLAVVGAIVGEFMGADIGLGYLLLFANGYLDTKLLFATIVLLALLGIVLFYVVVWIERLVIPWHASQLEATGGTL